jgi:2-hydroxymuconate-semialdehyde hydrolase
MSKTFISEFVEIAGLKAHVWQGGDGYPLLLMHGAGPGTSAAGNFAKVRHPLAKRYTVYGTDMIGFGESDRKVSAPYFDYDLWLRQMQVVLDSIPGSKVGLVGHSISATYALRLAGTNPKVDKVLLTCPIGTDLEPNSDLDVLWSFPKDEQALRRSLRVLIPNDELINDELVKSRMEILNTPGYDSYFRKVFSGDNRELLRPTILTPEELQAVKCPVSIIHGRNDLAFPQEQTASVLIKALPQADLHLLSACSHGPAFERPDAFLDIAFNFFG